MSRADKCQGRRLIPAVSNGGNEENDKKKLTKIESGSFWEIYLIRGQIWKFFDI